MRQPPSILNVAIIAGAVVASVGLWLLMESTTPHKRGTDRGTSSDAAGPAAAEPAPPPRPSTYAVPTAPSPAPATAPGEAPGAAPAEEAAAAAQLTEEMKKLARDLEYSPGLREPPQQLVQPVPEPWRPDPAAKGRPPPAITEVAPRAGAPGALVKIRGKNLRTAQVMFGTLPAHVVGDGDDELTVVAPEGGEGLVPVAVTNTDGSFDVANDAFTYRP